MKATELSPSVPIAINGADAFAEVVCILREIVSTSVLELNSFAKKGRSIIDVHEDIGLRLGKGDRPRFVRNLLHFNSEIVRSVDALRSNVASPPRWAHDDDEDRLLECLTGVWLSLYFIGIPSPHAWEAVLYFADRNGFPRGACLSKAAGDVYRDARRQ